MRLLAVVFLFMFASPSLAARSSFNAAATSSSSTSIPFTALHTYFMAPTAAAAAGNDSNSGNSPSSPWATPNHALNCGDVIIAAAGTYTVGFNNWGKVSNCPSVRDGIDGRGGVYFSILLCGGGDLESCKMDVSAQVCCRDAFGVNADNWAIEGWKATAGVSDAYIMEAAATGTTQLHHIAFINDIAYNSQMGFQEDDGALNHNVPGNGVDYYAFIGDIAQNAAQSGYCVAGINAVGPSQWDTNPGTHILIMGNFSYDNINVANCPQSDGEDFMLDTFDAHGYSAQAVWSNNIGFDATRTCWQLTQQNIRVSTPTLKVYNNTCYGDLRNVGSDSADGEINFGSTLGGSSIAWSISLSNNLAQTNAASNSGRPIYGAVIGGTHWTSFMDSGNFLNGSATSCAGVSCNSSSAPFSTAYFNGNNPSGSDTYLSPGYTNVSDLMTNRTGTPTCTGFATTTACMGWSANTCTLATPSVISDLVPTASGTGGKGYQLPSLTCAPNSDYPTWLKGVVYLQWNGTTITENAGLVNKPCGL
jgi:hypothetical protein